MAIFDSYLELPKYSSNHTNQTLILLNTLKKNLQGYMYNVRFLNHDIQFMRESYLRANFCVVECI